MSKSRLNNRKLEFQRKELVYEAVMTDLVLMGALPRSLAEKFIGHEIPEYLTPPAGVEASEIDEEEDTEY